MTTIDMMQAGIGRWMIARTERRARTRTRMSGDTGMRALRGALQLAGLGWLDYAAWDISRTAGCVAVGLTLILVSAMISSNGEGRGEGRT
jgi:hypothetical protein